MESLNAYDRATRLRELERYDEAYPLFEKAAEDGEIHAKYWLAYIKIFPQSKIYYDYEGSKTLFRSFYPSFLKLANEGDKEALFFLGSYHENAYPPIEQRDLIAARAFFQKAADKGSAISWNCLGNIERDENGNYPKALEDYLKSADLGFLSAYNNAGNLSIMERQT
jgi:TPR repeat protein